MTAEDSQFSYETAACLFHKVNPDVIARALNIYALNPGTIFWGTSAGYVPPNTINGFFMPLPENAWGYLDAEKLIHSGMVDRTPLGWGAYFGEKATRNLQAAQAVSINENNGYRVINNPGTAWVQMAGEAQM